MHCGPGWYALAGFGLLVGNIRTLKGGQAEFFQVTPATKNRNLLKPLGIRGLEVAVPEAESNRRQ